MSDDRIPAELAERLAALSPSKRELLLRRLDEGRQATPATEIRPRAGNAARLPLSYAQQRLWFLDQLEPDTDAYNNHAALRIRGSIDIGALRRALEEIVQRHEVLRTTFATDDELPVQVIGPSSPIHLDVVDLSDLPSAEAEAEVLRLGLQAAEKPFDLSRGPLLRLSLLKLADDRHVLLLVVHHITSDGFFVNVFGRELAMLHAAFRAGQPSPLPDLPIQYADFTLWQRDWLQGERLEGHLAYWRKQLDGLAPLDLTTDRPRPPEVTFNGARETLLLPAQLLAALNRLSRDEGATLFMTLLAAFQTLLSRMTAQDDIVVGTPIANRNRREIEGLIGFFVNNLTLRSDLSGDPSFRTLLGRVREVALGAYAHQDVPFERLVEELKPERDRSRPPLFQVLFALQNLPLDGFELSGLAIDLEPLPITTTRFELELHLWEAPGGELSASLIYNTDLFDRDTVSRMLDHYRTLLEGVAADADQPLSALPILGDPELRQLRSWNDTGSNEHSVACTHELFEAQVERSPKAVAVTCEGDHLSYRELDRRANQIARRLRQLGVGPEVLVGLCLDRTPDLVAAILGIHKAGGAYVPLDPTYPPERVAFMLRDARAPVIVTHEEHLERLPQHDVHRLCLDRDRASIEGEPDDAIAAAGAPSRLAHVIYTSGSTGRPKGVAIPQSSVVGLIQWARQVFDERDLAGVLASTSICFDLSVFEIFVPLCSGGRVILVDNALALPETEAAGEVSLVNTVPSAAAELVATESIPSSVRTVCLAGEPLRQDLVERLYDDGRVEHVYDLYGPSEDTTYSTWMRRAPGGRDTIGRPIANSQAHVLDRRQQLVPIGVPGELYLAGNGLARGYLNQPAMSAERFVPNPFAATAGRRLYRTGDRVRHLADGRLEFLGRIDHQVKLRGFRIELGEIEVVLGEHAAVREAVVVVRDERLLAYVVWQPGQTASPVDLRASLKETLPDYMVPAAFVPLEALPLNANGKLDRSALPAPDGQRPELEHAFVAPRTHLEAVLATIFGELLQVEDVGVRDNFFALGGHSLLATKVVSRVREALQVEMPLRELFRGPTVEDLAATLLADPAERDRVETASELYMQVAAMSDGDVERLLAE